MKKLFYLSLLLTILYGCIPVPALSQSEKQSDAYTGTATGTNTYSVTINAVMISAPYDNQRISVRFTNGNTSTATLKVIGTGGNYSAIAINLNGSALVSGDIPAGAFYDLKYNATTAKWDLQKTGINNATYTLGQIMVNGRAADADGKVNSNNGNSSLNFNTRLGFTATNHTSIDWDNQQLLSKGSSDAVSLDWNAKQLKVGKWDYAANYGAQYGVRSLVDKRYVDSAIAILNAWGLTGNSGTGGSNFLGTTDAQDIIFKVNNSEYARMTYGGHLQLANKGIQFTNSGNSNYVRIINGVTSSSYILTLPLAQGAANSYLLNDGSGILSWSNSAPLTSVAKTYSTAATFTTGVTSPKAILTYTTSASDNSYRVSGNITLTALSLDHIQYQVVYTDEANNINTINLQLYDGSGSLSPTILTTGGYAALGADIHAKASTTITLQVNPVVGTGSATFNAGAIIQQE